MIGNMKSLRFNLDGSTKSLKTFQGEGGPNASPGLNGIPTSKLSRKHFPNGNELFSGSILDDAQADQLDSAAFNKQHSLGVIQEEDQKAVALQAVSLQPR
jgi:hypothetical protein